MAYQRTRIQNVATIQTVKNAPGLVHSILLSSADAAAQTLTLTDGSTVLNVINIAAGASQAFVLDCPFNTSIKVTPSDAQLDALIVYT